ncbi:MAG: c-type cytochrome [Vicinamibacterales bacterium]
MQFKTRLVPAVVAGLTLMVAVHVTAQAPPQAPAPNPPPAQAPGAAGAQAPAAQGRGRAAGGPATFPAQQRPQGDPTLIARGKVLFGISCVSCHGTDLRGGDEGGPNLLRSDTVLKDQAGELILPIVHGSRSGPGGMAAINLPDADVLAIAEYIHSVVASARGQGAPPAGPPVVLNILVGNAAAGQAYFTSKCSSCHSATGDLRAIGSKAASPTDLQNGWISGSVGGGGGRGGGGRGGGTPVTVTVTPAAGPKVDGRLVRVDDFQVVVGLADGTMRTFNRDGDVPKVEVHDPMEGHRKLLAVYTDKDIHDVTAYLVTLK